MSSTSTAQDTSTSSADQRQIATGQGVDINSGGGDVKVKKTTTNTTGGTAGGDSITVGQGAVLQMTSGHAFDLANQVVHDLSSALATTQTNDAMTISTIQTAAKSDQNQIIIKLIEYGTAAAAIWAIFKR